MSDQDDIPRGYWKDAMGNLVPVGKVKPLDKARDALVQRLISSAKEQAKEVAEFKAQAFADIDAFVQASAAEYGTVVRGAAGKGNVTLTSFDGRFKVVKAVQDKIMFDERVQVAKAIIDERVHTWSKGANQNLRAIVNHAFQVDKAGNISVSRVLSLRQIKIQDPEWERAMAAIADSMKAASSKSYVRFYERDEATGEYLAISVDVSAV